MLARNMMMDPRWCGQIHCPQHNTEPTFNTTRSVVLPKAKQTTMGQNNKKGGNMYESEFDGIDFQDPWSDEGST